MTTASQMPVTAATEIPTTPTPRARAIRRVRKAILNRAARPVVVRVVGDCLTPFGIVHGDSVVVDAANTTPRYGEIIACALNGEKLLKVFLPGECWVRLGYADGSQVRSIAVKPSDTLAIIGVFVGVEPTGARRWPTWAEEEEEEEEIPLLSSADLKYLPYWKLSSATNEWVRYRADGTEIDRQSVTSGEGV